MIEVKISHDQAVLSLSLDELITINNALNEVCNALDVPDFQTRMGVELEEALALLGELRQTIDRMSACK